MGGNDLLFALWLFMFLNARGLIAAALLFGILLLGKVNSGRAFALSCFFAIGFAIARLQLMIFYDVDSSEIDWNIVATVPSVAVLSLLALVFSARRLRQDRLLASMFVLTVLLGVLQFMPTPISFLNWYARFFALLCLAVPLFVFANSQRLLMQSWRSNN